MTEVMAEVMTEVVAEVMEEVVGVEVRISALAVELVHVLELSGHLRVGILVQTLMVVLVAMHVEWSAADFVAMSLSLNVR